MTKFQVQKSTFVKVNGVAQTVLLGKKVPGFHLTTAGLQYIKRNRLQNVVKLQLQLAVNQTKEDIALYIMQFWAQDTFALVQSALQLLRRDQWYDLASRFKINIGSAAEYFKYVLTMYKRMKARGKSVKWTNPFTKRVQKDFIGITSKYARERLKINIDRFLKEVNLGWLFGVGRMPKAVVVKFKLTTPGRKPHERTVTPYRGKEKIVQRG